MDADHQSKQNDRRQFLTRSAGSVAFAAMAASMQQRLQAEEQAAGGKTGIKHSVCKWCYPKNSIEEIATAGKQFGLVSIELLDPADIVTAQKNGLTCGLVNFARGKTDAGVTVGGIQKAWNRLEHHDALVATYSKRIEETKALGLDNIICFSGNRDGMDDEEGQANCATGLKRILPLAEKNGITITMELLNSAVNHKDYMCDRTAWGTSLCDMIGSEQFKLLYDIYHMQIMEGNVIKRIKDNHQYFSHYHTGGVPGRHEIDETQELNYPAIVRAIKETGYSAFLGQEFIPAREDKLASLKQGVEICTV